jgi:hypothetical protein
MSRDSAVGIVTGYGLDDQEFEVRVPFTSPGRPDRLWGPPTLLFNGYQRLFLRGGVQRPGREAAHSPTNAEVKKTWIYISTSPCLHGVVLN